MASIFKRTADKGRRGTPWYIAYKDGSGKRRTIKGFTDKNATESLAQELEIKARLRRLGIIDAKADRQQGETWRSVSSHLADYHKALLAKGNTAKHADGTRSYIARLIALTKAERISDLTQSSIQNAVASLKVKKQQGEVTKEEEASHRTRNAYLRAIKGFTRWLWRDGRNREDALTHLQGFNEAVDRKRRRRDFTEAELCRLFLAASEGNKLLGMEGPDRAMLYRLAVGTGFRAGELRSLTPEFFCLDQSPPTVKVTAAYSKRRRDDVQPIRRDLAAILRPWLAGKAAGKPVFRMPEKTAEMLRRDMEAANILYQDKAGHIADFHALRHTFVSMLIRNRVNIKVTQDLARHSTPTLTMDRYAHVGLEDQTSPLSALPSLLGSSKASEPERDQATIAVTTDGVERPAPAQRLDGEARRGMANYGELTVTGSQQGDERNSLESQKLDVDGRDLAESGESAPRRTRTYNPLIKSQLLCQLS